jgi:hypothetical protein
MSKAILIFTLLCPFLSSAELSPSVDPVPGQSNEVVEFINEFGEVQTRVPFDSRTKNDWDIKDVVIVDRVQAYGEDSTLRALRAIESAANDRLLSIQEQDEIYNQASGSNYPTWRNPFKTDILDDASVSVSVGVPTPYPVEVGVSLSLPLVANTDLDQDQKAELIKGLKKLRDIYDSPDTSNEQKATIASFFDYYLDFDISKSSDDILAENDGTAVEYKAILSMLQGEVGDLGESLKAHVDKALNEALEGETKIITEQAQLVSAQVSSEAEAIKDLIVKTNESEFEAIDDANIKLDYLTKKQVEAEVIQRISSITNADKLEKEIQDTKDCQSTDGTSSCAVSKEKLPVMEARLSKLRQTDIRSTTRSGLKLAQDVALLVNDKKTAGYISKSIQGYDAVIKISDLATGLAGKTAMAATGDVMSMFSLVISVGNLFGSGGGPSADELILKQLHQIRLEIEAVRKQMHERFDDLSTQISHLGLGLNLKLDTIGDNIGVLADNQSLLRELIINNSFMIANLAQVQSNNSIVQIAQRLEKNYELMQFWNDPAQIVEIYLDNLAEFSSYLKYNTVDSLLWASAVQTNNYDISSTEALLLASNLSPEISQADSATFGLIDYLIKNSVSNNLGGNCSDLNFNDVYLFNVLGSQVLNTLRSEFDTLPIDSNGASKYNYVLKAEAISQRSIYNLFELPIQNIDSILVSANKCLNNFAVLKDENSTPISLDVNFVT